MISLDIRTVTEREPGTFLIYERIVGYNIREVLDDGSVSKRFETPKEARETIRRFQLRVFEAKRKALEDAKRSARKRQAELDEKIAGYDADIAKVCDEHYYWSVLAPKEPVK